MAVRLNVRLKRGSLEVTTSALVNSGFEADTPVIAVPLRLARRLGLWPSQRASLVELDTAGGRVETPYIKGALELEVLVEEGARKSIVVDVIVAPRIDEILISDYVASELGLLLLDLRRGLWRFSDDHSSRIRKSASPQYW